MKPTWTRNPASLDGPAVLEARLEGLRLTITEHGNHWMARIATDADELWSYPARTESEAKTRIEAELASGRLASSK